MLLLTGTAIPLDSRRDALKVAAMQIANETQADDGCVFYQFSEDLETGAIIGVEIWRDREALAAHMQHNHTIHFLAGLIGAFASDPVMTETEIH
jgi:quinol monooxygenase YgiN